MAIGADSDGWTILAEILGWTYFFCWSFSFYPQLLLNWNRKRVDGMSIDWAVYNSLAFGCYTVYTCSFMWNHTVRDEYRRRNGGQDNGVMPNDVAFAIHAWIIATILVVQTFIYPRAEGQRLSLFNKSVIVAFVIFAGIEVILVLSGVQNALDFMYHLSYFKLWTTLAKYCSQAHVNWARKSTVGYSVQGVILDETGAILSLLQSVVIAVGASDWSIITGNPVKLGLSLFSGTFPLFFLFQHYVLYPDARRKVMREQAARGERTPLLGP